MYLDKKVLDKFKSVKFQTSKTSGWTCFEVDTTTSGKFDVLAFNVHGSYGHGGVDYATREKIGKMLQQVIDERKDKEEGVRAILALQEDWRYDGTSLVIRPKHWGRGNCFGPEHTRKNITLPFQSDPHLKKCVAWWNDGLNLFADFSFDSFLYRETWKDLEYRPPFGAYKGFSRATLYISNNFEIDVYNVHAGPYELRPKQFEQLTNSIKANSNGKAVIVVGDTNLNWIDRYWEKVQTPNDLKTFEKFLDDNKLQSACRVQGNCICKEWPLPHSVAIDQILYRGNTEYSLETVSFEQLDFKKISDHEPILARFEWRKK
jgi:hypothetical protein